jgi:3-oxoacyl-[acyl-carrier-protein] synthase II
MTRAHGKTRVAITGRGIVTALGVGLEENWRRLVGGESGVKSIARFDTTGLKTRIAATVDIHDRAAVTTNVKRTYLCARDVLEQALAEAELRPALRSGVPLFMGSPVSEGGWRERLALFESATGGGGVRSLASLSRASQVMANGLVDEHDSALNGARLADQLGLDGQVVTVTTACASGASAIQLATDAIRRGQVYRAIVVAADAAVSPESVARFSLLSALSTANAVPAAASRPFDAKRDGFVMGEGAACLVLESEQAARQRRARIFGYVLGCGSATDNYHKTRSHPSGQCIVSSMKAALLDAGLGPTDIDSINAHGTSTQENDKMESLAINLLFGEHTRRIHVTSNKSMIGHTLCAAGAIEALFSLESILKGVVPPTINLSEVDPAVALNLVAGEAREAKARTVLSNSLGFGGQNATLVLGAAS